MGVVVKDACGDGKVLYVDCINVSLLVVTLGYPSARCYHWGN